MDGSGLKRRFSHCHENYRHPHDAVSLRQIERIGLIETTDGVVRAQLYEAT